MKNWFYCTSMNSKHFLLSKSGTGTGYKRRTWGRGWAFRKCLLISKSSKQWHESFQVHTVYNQVHKYLDRDCFCNVAYVHHHNGSNIKPLKCDWSEEFWTQGHHQTLRSLEMFCQAFDAASLWDFHPSVLFLVIRKHTRLSWLSSLWFIAWFWSLSVCTINSHTISLAEFDWIQAESTASYI